MKILITGAGGFLGQYLASNLQQHQVVALSRQQLDLCSVESVHTHFARCHYDMVIHCAASGRYRAMTQDWSIVHNNLSAMLNLLSVQHCWDRLINIGTGAEFDLAQHIDQVSEDQLWYRNPQHSYGFSKNIIAKCMTQHSTCTTLRLFGCFDSSEDKSRLLKQCQSAVMQGQQFTVPHRMFDIISARDFVIIVQAVIERDLPWRDINCVYQDKFTLEHMLKLFCRLHGWNPDLIVAADTALNYTGNGDRLHSLALPLLGLEGSLAVY